MSQIKFVGDAALQQNIDETKQYIKEHSTNSASTMPTANSSLVGKIYQYVGTTTSTYTKGHFYECINDNGTYKWQEIPMGSVVVDDALSSTSTNPVQNKVIKSALDAKLSSNSDVSNTVETTITTSSASYPEIAAGETLKVIFGKIKKYLSDLKGKFDTFKSKGSATNGVYFDANGNIQKMTYTVNKTVPSDAKFTDTTYSVVSKTANGLAPQLPNETSTTKFLRQDGSWQVPPNTDTKNTAGSTDSSSKLFLIGATSQAANPQTYSQDTAYVGTDGNLYSGSKIVATQSMIGDAWVTSHAYAVGDYCIDGNVLYKCKTAHTSSASNRPPYASYWSSTNIGTELSQLNSSIQESENVTYSLKNTYSGITINATSFTIVYTSSFGRFDDIKVSRIDDKHLLLSVDYIGNTDGVTHANQFGFFYPSKTVKSIAFTYDATNYDETAYSGTNVLYDNYGGAIHHNGNNILTYVFVPKPNTHVVADILIRVS